MPVFGTQMFGSGGVSSYEIDNSCVFDSASSAYMSKASTTPTLDTKFTFSTWLKRGNYDGSSSSDHFGIFGHRQDADAANKNLQLAFFDDMLYCAFIDGGSVSFMKYSNALYRDPAAWYHIVFIGDSTDGTAADRVKLYVNGTRVTAFTGDNIDPAEDETFLSTSCTIDVGRFTATDGSSHFYFDGYMADVYYIDGTAYAASDFGETNDEGVWIPKSASSLTFGNNGFYLNFKDSSNLGNDVKGGTDLTETNIAAADQSTDVPTNNHCTWNSIFQYATAANNIFLTEGNRNFKHTGGDQRKTIGTMFPTSGKWYWEVKWVSGTSGGEFGISQADVIYQYDMGDGRGDRTGKGIGYRTWDGRTYYNDGLAAYGDSLSAGDTGSIAWDVDNGKIYFAKNGTWQNSADPTSGATGTGAFGTTLSSAIIDGGPWTPAVCNEGSNIYETHFAEAEWTQFSGAAPTGYSALCTSNMAEPAIKDGSKNFQMDDYAGTGSTLSRTFGGNSDMKPDILWIKAKNTTTGWIEFNAAVGVQKYNTLNEQGGETSDSNSLTAFNTDGFTVGSLATVNSGSYGFFAFGWSAGGSGSSNTAGSINTTTTFVDATAGISVGTYTGTGSGATVGHGLGVTPATVIIFPRSDGDHKPVANWQSGISAYGEKWKLNETEAAASSSGFVTAASSTTFTLGTDVNINGDTRTYSYYAFAEVPGFSKFGTYTGNGNADGTFVWCGFRPAIFIAKADRAGEDWIQFNTKTDPNGNPAINYAYPDDTDAFTNSSNFLVDFLSNGVKMRGSEGRINRDGETIVFMAFAENPFGGEDAAPATAR